MTQLFVAFLLAFFPIKNAYQTFTPEPPEPVVIVIPQPIQDPLAGSRLTIVTAYCSCAKCCGKYSPELGGHGLTRIGVLPDATLTVAANTKVFPLGTHIYIEGIGGRIVQDTGSAVAGLDLYMSSHDDALRFGAQRLRVWRLED